MSLGTAPREPAILQDLGNALRSLGKNEESLSIFRQWVEIAPESALAHHRLGNVLQNLGQLSEAIASYREALRLDPECVDERNLAEPPEQGDARGRDAAKQSTRSPVHASRSQAQAVHVATTRNPSRIAGDQPSRCMPYSR